MNLYTKLTLDYLRYNKRRTAFILVGIMFSVGLISSISTFFFSFGNEIIAQTKRDAGSYHIIVRNAEPAWIDYYRKHASIEKVGLVHEEKVKSKKGKEFILRQMDPIANELLPIGIKQQVSSEIDGIMIEKRSLIWLDKQLKLGDQLQYVTPDQVTHSAPITGLLLPNNNLGHGDQLYNQFLYAYQLLPTIQDTKHVKMYMKFKSHVEMDNELEGINQLVGKENVTQNFRYVGNLDMGSESWSEASIQFIPIFLVVIVTFAFIYGTFHISVSERTRHIGMLRAMGATKSNIRTMMLIEVSILSGIGIPLGLMLGIFGLWFFVWLYRMIFVLQEHSFFQIQFNTSFSVILISVVVSLVSIFVSTWLPTRKAVRISPLAGIRQDNMSNSRYKGRFMDRIYAKLLRIETLVILRSMFRNRRRFIVTVFALGFGLVLFSIFTCSISLISKDQYNIRKNSPDFVLYNNESNRQKLWSLQELRDIEQVRDTYEQFGRSRVLFYLPYHTDVLSKYHIGAYTTIDSKPYKSYLSTWNYLSPENRTFLKSSLREGTIPTAQQKGKSEVVLLLNDDVQIPTLHVGDEIFIQREEINEDKAASNRISEQDLVKAKITAIAHHNTSSRSLDFIVTPELYKLLLPESAKDVSSERVDVFLHNHSEEQVVLNDIEQIIAQDPNWGMNNILKDTRNYRQAGVEILILLYAFVIVILIIGSTNMMNTMVMNILIRKKEFATLRSIGLSYRSLQRMIIKEGIIYGVFSALFSAAVSYSFIYVTQISNSLSTTWIFVSILLIPLVVTMGIGYISAKIALRSLKTDNLITLLKG
ncbi:ABC transporter permease [Paenibacillus sp. N1-5-1-14]|uniref:ABC transporter permease n=1 Tax=Paenibacillus radicibacter TaxID=2972488 RepID=UPI002159ADF7|nr:ABC transporter permease [Paenibacillus radicibacter]MCR8641230.1 ABC transporter permease [Paenibacillus radicibacter]